jgi:hypothetical protein
MIGLRLSLQEKRHYIPKILSFKPATHRSLNCHESITKPNVFCWNIGLHLAAHPSHHCLVREITLRLATLEPDQKII